MKNIIEQQDPSRGLEVLKDKDVNTVEKEFDTLETEFSFLERMDIARDLFEELSNLDSNLLRQALFQGTIQYREAQKGGDLKHYFLPGIPGGEGDMEQIREGYDSRAEYSKSGKYVFVRVGQGEMWVVPKKENPYFKVGMSECSTLVGEDEDKIIVAHISFSALNEIGAVMTFMEKNGIPRERVYAIASVGPFQREQSGRDYTKRAISVEDYVDLGIPEFNIKTFEYKPGQRVSDQERISSNITRVLVSRYGLFKWSFDLKEHFRVGSHFPKEERIGDYKNEELIEFNKQ